MSRQDQMSTGERSPSTAEIEDEILLVAKPKFRRWNQMSNGEGSPPATKINADMRLGLRLLAKLARIAEQACQATGISLPQYRLLSEIVSGPCRLGTLAVRVGVTRPTLTSLVHGLEETRLLVRLSVPTDRRGIAVRATDAGIAAVDRAEAALAARLTGLAGRARMADVTGLARHMSSALAE